MAENSKPAATAGDDVRYDVKLSGRIELHGFWYLPSHEHVVDQVTLDAMTEAGVVADVKQLS
ncbi:hypothetical protein V1279_003063 [Bradyrhizobium sp. AZCC 1610]|uniref:hypothetical protein n=1 Tax=Bradyrhizobium sp. AZCC 1610 TaxID=3117020 RepID=UPI002FEFC984